MMSLQENEMTEQKPKSVSFAIWDLLPMFALAVILVFYITLRTNFDGTMSAHWDARALLRIIILATLVWGFLTMLIRTGKGLMDSLTPMRGLATFCILLMGLGLLLRPTMGDAGFGIGLGMYFLAIFIGLVAFFIKFSKHAPPVLLENDPIRQEQFWKCNDTYYFNKKDERLFVPKRNSESEYATNLAHKNAWIFIFTIGIIPMLPFVLKLLLP